MAKTKKTIVNQESEAESQASPEIEIPASQALSLIALQSEIEALKQKDIANQEKLKMLYEVADKGRVFNYEAQRTEKKPVRVKLSIYNGKTIIGWRTLKDELIKHPTTGLTVGEVQEYELWMLNPDGTEERTIIHGYPAFSDARYKERIECEIIGKREDYQGNIDFDVQLPDGRKISVNSRFVN